MLAAAAAASARGVTTVALPDLSYDFGALEPAISGEIMRLHHQKHHATYVTNYNKTLEQLDAAVSKGDASAVVQLQGGAIKFNGGVRTVLDFNFRSVNDLLRLVRMSMESISC